MSAFSRWTTCLGMVLWVTLAEGATPEPNAASHWRDDLKDPAWRWRASQPGGLQEAMSNLGAGQQEVYDALRTDLKADADHALECRLVAALARALHRPEAELMTADDALLRAAPRSPEGWFNRAERLHRSDKESDKKAAIETCLQGLRRLDMSQPGWQELPSRDATDWQQIVVKAGHYKDWMRALADALRDTLQGEADFTTTRVVLEALRDPAMRDEPDAAAQVLDAMTDAQPQLVLGDVAGFFGALRQFDDATQPQLARQVARMLVLAPIPTEMAATEGMLGSVFLEKWEQTHPEPMLDPAEPEALGQAKLESAQSRHQQARQRAMQMRNGALALQRTWEDTLPRYLPGTKAREAALAAVSEGGDLFAAQCVETARTQPWNENLVCHALLANALTTALDEETLSLAKELPLVARGRIAQRLRAFAPIERLPMEPLSDWVEQAAMEQVQFASGKAPERAVFESLLAGMEFLNQAGQDERLTRVLHAVKTTPPRALDVEHWQRWSELILLQKEPQAAADLLQTWLKALNQDPVERDHLLAMANAAVLGSTLSGTGFAKAAMDIWERGYAGLNSAPLPDAGIAARVAEAQLACGDAESFSKFVALLEKRTEQASGSTIGRVSKELRKLQRLLDGDEELSPAVEIWLRDSAEAGKPLALHWRMALPELGTSPTYALRVGTGDRDSRRPADKYRDARWWRAGTVLPALAKLTGKFDLEVLAGDSPDRLRPLKTIKDVAASGSVLLDAKDRLPASGCMRAILRPHAAGEGFFGEPRAFSQRKALFATGAEPDATAADQSPVTGFNPAPWPDSWQAEDKERWGQLLTEPLPVKAGEEFLLTRWPSLNAGDPAALGVTPTMTVRMILLDEQKQPLGPVPVASSGFTQGYTAPTEMLPNTRWQAEIQRFRPSDWAGDGDLVTPLTGESRAGDRPAKYVAFVTRNAASEGPLPRLQLRQFSEPYTGGPVRPPLSKLNSTKPQLPELNDEHIGDLGFYVHSWHVTFAADRAVFGGKGMMMAFDVTKIPWKPVLKTESELIEGNEWPHCYTPDRACVIEPSWNGTRTLGVRFVPFDSRGLRYGACQRKELPLPTYSSGEFADTHDGAVLMVDSQRGDQPEPAVAWVEPDGECHVVKLPRPPIKDKPGLEVAWWGPGGTLFTLYEDGWLFHMEHRNGLRLIKAEPGSPDDMPEGASPGRSQRKRSWKLERPDVLVEVDKKTSAPVRRYHLPKPCVGTPMSFEDDTQVILMTSEHEIIRVNPPPRE